MAQTHIALRVLAARQGEDFRAVRFSGLFPTSALLATLFGMALLKKGMPPFFPPWQLPLIMLAAILFICWLAAALGKRKIRSLESAVVFRG